MRVRSSAQVKRLQMMARVPMDASHVSRSVTARREKMFRYIRVSQRTSEVRMFRLSSLRLRVSWVYWERTGSRFLESSWVLLLVFGDSVTDLDVGVRSAAAAPLCSFAGSWGGSWRRTEVEAVHTLIQAWRGKLQRFGQQAGSLIKYTSFPYGFSLVKHMHYYIF